MISKRLVIMSDGLGKSVSSDGYVRTNRMIPHPATCFVLKPEQNGFHQAYRRCSDRLVLVERGPLSSYYSESAAAPPIRGFEYKIPDTQTTMVALPRLLLQHHKLILTRAAGHAEDRVADRVARSTAREGQLQLR